MLSFFKRKEKAMPENQENTSVDEKVGTEAKTAEEQAAEANNEAAASGLIEGEGTGEGNADAGASSEDAATDGNGVAAEPEPVKLSHSL